MRAMFLLLLVPLLAGCADEAAPEVDDFAQNLDQELQATEDTGIIRGVVVDFAIVPVADATVTLTGLDRSTQTNEAGAFGFDGLEPGTYFLEISKLGYNSTQASTDVEAGTDTPPVVKVRLEAAPLKPKASAE